MVKAYAVNWSEAWPIPDDESKEGHYVKYEDYAALAAECAALKKAVPPLKMINADNDSWDDVSIAEEIGFNQAISEILRNLPQTPATDRFLAEQRAQGVEMFADKTAECGWHESTTRFVRTFAAKLRNEVKV